MTTKLKTVLTQLILQKLTFKSDICGGGKISCLNEAAVVPGAMNLFALMPAAAGFDNLLQAPIMRRYGAITANGLWPGYRKSS
jgi:hypothetical protein